MSAEISVFGVFVPSMLPCALFAAALTAGLSRLLVSIGFYRFVWHRALFDFSIFICALGAVLAVAPKVSS